MVSKTKIKSSLRQELQEGINLDQFPDLKEAIVSKNMVLPIGSFNTKIIISGGEVVERVYKTPKGELISLFPNTILNQVA